MIAEAVRFCDVWALAQKGGRAQGELALRQLPRLAAELVDTEGSLQYRLEGLIDDRGRAAARFEVDGVVNVRCDRCGESVQLPIHEGAQFFFVADEDELAGLPIDESPQEPLLGSDRFDLAALVEDQVILALPISPRHDHCSGPGAGAEDARGPAETRRPFAVLAALKRPGR